MSEYQVLAGKHYQAGDPEPYVSGDIVETDLPLDKMFANKFLRIGAPVVPEQQTARQRRKAAGSDKAPGKAPKGQSSMATMDQDELPNTMHRRTVMNDEVMDNYKDHAEILAGKKRGPAAKTIVAGSLSSRDLGAEANDAEEQPPQAQRGQEEGDEGGESEFGQDVTDQFEGAGEANLVVFKKKANQYHIVEKDEPTKPLTKKAGVKKVDVKKFVKEYGE